MICSFLCFCVLARVRQLRQRDFCLKHKALFLSHSELNFSVGHIPALSSIFLFKSINTATRVERSGHPKRVELVARPFPQTHLRFNLAFNLGFKKIFIMSSSSHDTSLECLRDKYKFRVLTEASALGLVFHIHDTRLNTSPVSCTLISLFRHAGQTEATPTANTNIHLKSGYKKVRGKKTLLFGPKSLRGLSCISQKTHHEREKTFKLH